MQNRIGMGSYRASDKDIKYVSESLRDGFLSAGPYVDRFETIVANYHDKKYGIFVSSGQSALEVAIYLAKKKLGKKKLNIIMPSTTYCATLWAVLNSGCNPILIDINKDFVIESDIDFSGEGPDVILSVDLCGKSAHKEAEEIKSRLIKLDKGIPLVINDACEAVGNTNVGYGDITCFSFYVSHIITTGYGGMVCLNDKNLEEEARSYIAHGRELGGDFTKFSDSWEDRFKFDKIGISCRESSLSAALGLSQFEDIEDIVERRKLAAKKICNSLRDCKLFTFPSEEYIEDSVFQFIPVLYNRFGGRDKFLKYLYSKGIDSRVLLSLTNQPIVKDALGEYIEKRFVFSNICNMGGFLIPSHQNLTDEDTDRIIEAFKKYEDTNT